MTFPTQQPMLPLTWAQVVGVAALDAAVSAIMLAEVSTKRQIMEALPNNPR
jgi:hypothetical protein